MLMIMMVAFLTIATILGITATSRIISAQYMQFSGFHNLAVGSAEQVAFLLQQKVELDESQIEQMLDFEQLEQFLLYENGNFYLSDNFMLAFRAEQNAAISAFLASSFTSEVSTTGSPLFSVSFSLAANEEIYTVITRIQPTAGNYNITSQVENTARISNPLTVSARLEWTNFSYDKIEITPKNYHWRDSPPEWWQSAEIPFADFLGNFSEMAAHDWHESTAILVTSNPQIDVSQLNNSIIIYTETANFEVIGNFTGLIIAPAQIEIDGTFQGGIIAGDAILSSPNAVVEPVTFANPNVIFDIEMHPQDAQIIFDFLGISNFGISSTDNVEDVLKYLQIEIDRPPIIEEILEIVQEYLPILTNLYQQ